MLHKNGKGWRDSELRLARHNNVIPRPQKTGEPPPWVCHMCWTANKGEKLRCVPPHHRFGDTLARTEHDF